MCNDALMDESDVSPASMVETPVGLRPDLGLYGIEEYDKGICEDTYPNRSILRKHKLSWNPIYDRSGRPTGQIEVLSQAMQEGRALATLEDKKTILKDPNDPNSDYITGLDLLYHGNADMMVPPWIISATREYDKIEDEREQNPSKKIRPNLVSFPGRCRYVKADGIRCQHWTAGRVTDDDLCRTHLGAKNSDAGAGAVERARQRIKQMAPRALDVLEEMLDDATSEQVRARAAEQILDRAGIRGGVEVDMTATVTTRPADEVLKERLDKLQKAAAVIEAAKKEQESDMLVLEAEVIEDEK